MTALRVSVVVLLTILFINIHAFLIDNSDDDLSSFLEYPLSKRNFQHIWRDIQMQMPQNGKRAESLTRARANAYYRLG
ncbi:hypothetical protein DICVIV_07884 [Dictyocaulus viviparus]|uniref:Uncharacterized protein n=1 Tax=Dictyocaulus viviparus TaxID=29172 RepID=A0A0D8XQK3_DICVI|nr:hypothetical protein DICVIV_07884 [Dictyocaulus viviparus]